MSNIINLDERRKRKEAELRKANQDISKNSKWRPLTLDEQIKLNVKKDLQRVEDNKKVLRDYRIKP